MELFINMIGLVIIDLGAFMYISIYKESNILAFILLLLGNTIGGILHKYSKN